MRYSAPLSLDPVQFELNTLEELSALPTFWVLPNLFPCHRLSLIAGRSGSGLTHLACRLAAAVAHLADLYNSPQLQPLQLPAPDSPALPLTPSPDLSDTPDPQDYTGPVVPNVLLIAPRDRADVLRPRLVAAGIDPRRVLIASQVYERESQGPDTYIRPFTPNDATLLDGLLHEHRSIRLVLLDNAELLFTAANRPTRSQLTRQLTQLAQVAERREVAIVLLATLPQLNANPFTTTMLSVYSEVSRMVYFLAPDPEDPDSRYVFCHKNTLASPTPTLHLRPAGASALGPTARPALLPQAYPSDLTFGAYLAQRSAPRRMGPAPWPARCSRNSWPRAPCRSAATRTPTPRPSTTRPSWPGSPGVPSAAPPMICNSRPTGKPTTGTGRSPTPNWLTLPSPPCAPPPTLALLPPNLPIPSSRRGSPNPSSHPIPRLLLSPNLKSQISHLKPLPPPRAPPSPLALLTPNPPFPPVPNQTNPTSPPPLHSSNLKSHIWNLNFPLPTTPPNGFLQCQLKGTTSAVSHVLLTHEDLMNILVTGAAGHIGSATCRHLHSQGHQVRATDMRLGKDLPVSIEIANLTHREACYSLVKGMDAVVHLGNIPNGWGHDPQTLLHDNVTNNMNVFQAATEAGVTKVVFASTVQVISGRRRQRRDQDAMLSSLPYLPLDGDTPPNPGNAYGLSKQLTEDMLRYFCQWNKLSAVAVRLPWVGELSWLAHDHSGDDWGFNADEAFSYLELSDAARLFEAILNADLPGFRIYFASGKENRRHQPANALAEKYFPNVPLRKCLDSAGSLIDYSRITAETGWTPIH